MIAVADRIKDTQEYYFSTKLKEIERINANGGHVLNLGIGSPDHMPPGTAIDELIAQSLRPETHGYQSYKGDKTLRNAFASWYERHYDVRLNPEDEILPLIGSKEGITHISMTYLQPGDEVLIPNPGYPAYASAAQLAGATIRHYELNEENSWLPDLKALQSTDLKNVKIMWVNYPHMPTGATATKSHLDELTAFGEENGILICNDNPYSFILTEKPISLLKSSPSPFTLELNSLSKSHNMAGWRLGMIAGHSIHIDNILRFKSNVDSGMFLPIQKAAVKALEKNNLWYEKLNNDYANRRKIAWQIMKALNCSYNPKQAGMFVWAKAPENIENTTEWMDQLLHEKQVFITPGFVFGSNGERYIRLSLCSNEKILNEALNRIKN